MPQNCPSCSERNPSNASKCLHCGAQLGNASEEAKESSNKNLTLIVAIVLAGVLGVLFYNSRGELEQAAANAKSIDRYCVKRSDKRDRDQLTERGYQRCESSFAISDCKKKGEPLCFEKTLAEGERKYRPGLLEW